jgi:hypothetical protein
MAHIYNMIILSIVFTVMVNNCMAERAFDDDKDILLPKLRSLYYKRGDIKTCQLDIVSFIA